MKWKITISSTVDPTNLVILNSPLHVFQTKNHDPYDSGNVSAGVLFSKVVYQRKRWVTFSVT